MVIRRVFLPALFLAAAGCSLDHCGTQDRSLDASAILTGASLADSGAVVVNFLQFRGLENQQSLSWLVRGTAVGDVTSVHIHRASTGDTLLTFTNGYAGPGDVITQSGPQLWSGTVGYEELFDLIRQGDTYVDVHTTAQPDGALRGELVVTGDRGWQDSCT